MRTIIGFLALVCLLPQTAHAEIELYSLDKPHTQIVFSVNHLGFSHSYGKFTDYEGRIEFNRSEPEKSKVKVTIHTNSVDMDDENWNDKLKGPDYFNVAKFPDMTFVAKGVKVTGPNRGVMTGGLTLLGITKPATLNVRFNKADKHPFSGKYVAGFSAETILNRSEFGMDSAIPFVSDEVDVKIEVEGIRLGKGTENE